MRFPSLTTTAGCVLWLGAACAAESPLAVPGRSTAPQVRQPSAEPPKTPTRNPTWQPFAESRDWPMVASFTTQSHPGQAPWVEVRVNPAQAQSYRELTRGQQLPQGTTILLTFRQEAGSPVLGHFSAKKLEGEWDYQILSATGAIKPADTTLCQRCHAEGRSDGLFGIPSAL